MYSMGDQFLSGNKVTLFDLPDGVTIASARYQAPEGSTYEASVGVDTRCFAVHQNYPNPFNPKVHRYQIDLPELSRVSVVIMMLWVVRYRNCLMRVSTRLSYFELEGYGLFRPTGGFWDLFYSRINSR